MIVIHIGLRKSGSASIQTFLHENVPELRKLSIDYAPGGPGRNKAHHNIALEIQGLNRFKSSRGTLSECVEYWRSSPHQTMVLSSELFEETDTSQAVKMRDALLEARGTDEFQIYLVIRDLAELPHSSYAHKIRYGFHAFDFDTHFSELMNTRRIHYFRTAQRWAKAFGWDNVHVRVLNAAHLFNHDLIDDFLEVCGVGAPVESTGLKRTGVQNAAPGWRVLEATRALRNGRHGLPPTHPLPLKIAQCPAKKKLDKKSGIKIAECATQVGNLRGWNTDRGQYLTRAQARCCYETYSASVVRLNEKLTRKLPTPIDLDGRGFVERTFLPDVSRIPQQELRAFYEDFWELFRDEPDDGRN